jgi:hypothetical protein
VLDIQAGSRIEPQLARIVEELEAIRQQGVIRTPPLTAGGKSMSSEAGRDSLVVYYFYGTTRCATCRSIEQQSFDAVHTDFVDQLETGQIVWKTLNYELPATRQLQTKFDIQTSAVVLARMKRGQVQQWNRLDRVWAYVDDGPAFREYVRDEITKMLHEDDAAIGDAAEQSGEPHDESVADL